MYEYLRMNIVHAPISWKHTKILYIATYICIVRSIHTSWLFVSFSCTVLTSGSRNPRFNVIQCFINILPSTSTRVNFNPIKLTFIIKFLYIIEGSYSYKLATFNNTKIAMWCPFSGETLQWILHQHHERLYGSSLRDRWNLEFLYRWLHILLLGRPVRTNPSRLLRIQSRSIDAVKVQ